MERLHRRLHGKKSAIVPRRGGDVRCLKTRKKRGKFAGRDCSREKEGIFTTPDRERGTSQSSEGKRIAAGNMRGGHRQAY